MSVPGAPHAIDAPARPLRRSVKAPPWTPRARLAFLALELLDARLARGDARFLLWSGRGAPYNVEIASTSVSY